MSSKQIKIPTTVSIKHDQSGIQFNGPKGELTLSLNSKFLLEINEENNVLKIIPQKYFKDNDFKKSYRSFFSKINNAIKGVSTGFFIEMKLQGVGYRFLSYKENILTFKAGYCNDLSYVVPDGVNICLETPTKLCFYSSDYDLLKQVASQVKLLRKPDSYKGKGFSYSLEFLDLKEVKKS